MRGGLRFNRFEKPSYGYPSVVITGSPAAASLIYPRRSSRGRTGIMKHARLFI